ncbi:hypothetical protein ACDX78_00795 [Virgibacillus oceani]
MFAGTWLNLTQLSILGVKEHHIYFIVLLLLMGIFYFMITPVIKWIISLQFSKLLSYMMSSLLLLILLFTLAMNIDGLEHSLQSLLKISLQGLSVFGVFLLIQSILGRFIKKQS